MIPIAIHVYTGTTLYALIDFTSEENNTVYFVTYYNYKDIRRFGKLDSIKGRFSKHTRTKRIAYKGDIYFSDVVKEYRKMCRKVQIQHNQYIIDELDSISKFTGYKKLFNFKGMITDSNKKIQNNKFNKRL